MLKLAAFGSEADVEIALAALLETGASPTADAVEGLIEIKPIPQMVHVLEVDTQAYDCLLSFPEQ